MEVRQRRISECSAAPQSIRVSSLLGDTHASCSLACANCHLTRIAIVVLKFSWARNVAQLVECSPNMQATLGSSPGTTLNQTWRCSPLPPALQGVEQGDQKVTVILGYIVSSSYMDYMRPGLKNNSNNKVFLSVCLSFFLFSFFSSFLSFSFES